MVFHNTTSQYGLTSKILHWLVAVLMISLLGLGVWMVDLGYYDLWYHDALSLHKGLGISLGVLVLLKLVWQFISPPPPPQASLNHFERFASIWVHRLLIAATLLLPATGYLVSSSEGAAIDVFSLFRVPALWEINDTLRDQAITVHYYIAYLILGAVLLHAGAALKHQFLDHKGTLKRMF